MSATEDAAAIDAALQGFRDMMSADGYVLGWEAAGPDAIVVKVEATEDACADCLVPEPVMQAIMASALESTSVTVDRVILPAAH
jgi:hypothetical protein